jgi:beta-galactosidase
MSFDLAGQDVPSGECYEILKPSAADVLAAWNPLPESAPSAAAGEPALTCHRAGKGAAFYLGTYLTAGNASAVLGRILAETTIQPLASAEGSVEITRRIAAGRALRVVLNHSTRPQTVTDLPAGEDLLTGQPCTGELTLPPYTPAVVREA